MGAVALRLTGAHLTLGTGAAAERVFAGLDLEIERGELLTIIGASGSGKSTLLSVLAGIRQLDAGTLEVTPDDSGITHAPAIVFQQPLLLPWRSVVDNVALGLSYRRHRRLHRSSGSARPWGPSSRRATRVGAAQALLERMGIGHLADRLPSELSGGQAQRAAIARAVVTEPAVLLLDEPFGALDANARHDLQQWLLELRTSMNLTIVLVTHDLDEALLLGDRVGVLTGPDDGLQLTPSSAPDHHPTDRHRVRDDLLARLGGRQPVCAPTPA